MVITLVLVAVLRHKHACHMHKLSVAALQWLLSARGLGASRVPFQLLSACRQLPWQCAAW
jgi:hypothetical protein